MSTTPSTYPINTCKQLPAFTELAEFVRAPIKMEKVVPRFTECGDLNSAHSLTLTTMVSRVDAVFQHKGLVKLITNVNLF